MNKPIYIVSGFLDSGKTSFLKEVLRDPGFNTGEKTLIIAFEEGDEEYSKEFLEETNSEVLYLDSLDDFLIPDQKKIDDEYKPDRVMLELNGLFDDTELLRRGFISNWEIGQYITIFDASKFNLYMTNMKQFAYNHIVKTEMVILNRIDNEDRMYLRNNIKAINPIVTILYEDKDGNVSNKLDSNYFDTSKPLTIKDDDYGMWYMDALEDPEKYKDAQIEINAYYQEDIKEYENAGIFGRRAMVCCANDISNIGFTVVGINKKDLRLWKNYHLKGVIHLVDVDENQKTCVLYIDTIEPIEKMKDDLVYFN